MKREIVICEADNLAAVIEDGRAVEFFLRQGDQLVGDIILGQVESVAQGIEAAFVNIGHDRNGFIHMADLPAAQSPRRKLKSAIVRPKEQLLVQIAKAPTGNKGARLTGRLSIPGRFVVFVSHDNRVNISRRITSPQERERLRDLATRLKDPGHGLIIRTEAEGASEEDLRKDIEELIAHWSDILHQSQLGKPPLLLYRDQDLLTRVLREAFTHDTHRLVVDSPAAAARARLILKNWMPDKLRAIQIHRGNTSLFKQFNLDREIKNALQSKVHLPSGGSLVIESTEAMTVVDVNSGRLVGSKNLAETVLRTNIEAANELARQLRLRDIGGVVVVDFISMDHAADQQKILNQLHEAMKPDKARPQIGSMFSEHGLLEISRRRQGQNLLEQLTRPCSHCKGLGRVRNEVLVFEEQATPVVTPPAIEIEPEEILDFVAVAEPASLDAVEAEAVEEAVVEAAEATPERKRRRRRRGRRSRGGAAETAENTENAEVALEETEEENEEGAIVEEIVEEPIATPPSEPETIELPPEPEAPTVLLPEEVEEEKEEPQRKRSRRPRRRSRKPAEPAPEAEETVETVEAIEPIETIELVEPVEILEPADAMEIVEIEEPVEPVLEEPEQVEGEIETIEAIEEPVEPVAPKAPARPRRRRTTKAPKQ
ncbi:MAG: Rne/Rng family ribonuclease, partial [Bacteroidota bacterium]